MDTDPHEKLQTQVNQGNNRRKSSLLVGDPFHVQIKCTVDGATGVSRLEESLHTAYYLTVPTALSL